MLSTVGWIDRLIANWYQKTFHSLGVQPCMSSENNVVGNCSVNIENDQPNMIGSLSSGEMVSTHSMPPDVDMNKRSGNEESYKNSMNTSAVNKIPPKINVIL